VILLPFPVTQLPCPFTVLPSPLIRLPSPVVGLTAAARAAYQAQAVAQDLARAATATLHDALAAMADAGADVIKKIRARAATDGNGVYALASIPAPPAPSKLPPPGTPTDFRVTLRPDGSLRLRWACANPKGSQGTIYQVARRVGSSGAFEVIGMSGVKRFDDTSVPAGAASVEYEIVALRSTARGEAARFVVNFGVSGDGAGAAMKIAA
jgi:hypothetical protein